MHCNIGKKMLYFKFLSRDYNKLHEYATEKIYPEMKSNVEKKTIYWQFVKSLEPPRTVSARVQDIITKDNHFAQIIVRMHTQQVSLLLPHDISKYLNF